MNVFHLKNLMISTFFRQTLEKYNIKGKRLSEISGVSENHISEFRRGKATVSAEILWKLLIAMDEIAPGARQYFCSLLGAEKSYSFRGELVEMIEAATDEEIETVMLAIAKKWRGAKHSSTAHLLQV